MLPLHPSQWSAARPACWGPSSRPPCLYRSWWGWRGRSWSYTRSARPQIRCNERSMKRKERERVFDCIWLPPPLPLHPSKLPALMNTPLLSINAASKGSPLSTNSRPFLLHSTYCSSCAAGVINCVPPGVKQRKSGSLTAKKEEKPAESDTQGTKIGDGVLIWVRQGVCFCSDLISWLKRKNTNGAGKESMSQYSLREEHNLYFDADHMLQSKFAELIAIAWPDFSGWYQYSTVEIHNLNEHFW